MHFHFKNNRFSRKMFDVVGTSADSGVKRKIRGGGAGTKQVCEVLVMSQTLVRWIVFPRTHDLGSIEVSFRQIMKCQKMSEDVRRCQKMSENIKKKYFASFYYHYCRQAPSRTPALHHSKPTD